MTNPANAASREARAMAALEPFAREADEQERVTSFAHGDCVIPRTKITIGDLRRARLALADEAASQPGEGGRDCAFCGPGWTGAHKHGCSRAMEDYTGGLADG